MKEFLADLFTGPKSSTTYIVLGAAAALGGIVTTIVATVKAVKEVETIENEHYEEKLFGEERWDDDNPQIVVTKQEVRPTRKEFVSRVLPKYIVPALLFVGSSSFFIASSQIREREWSEKIAAMGSTALSQASLIKTYENKLDELMGEEESEAYKQEAHAENDEPSTQILCTGHGDELFLDLCTGQLIKSSISNIEKVVNQLNHKMQRKMEYAAYAEFLSELDAVDSTLSYEYGWNINHSLIDVSFGTTAIGGKPVYTIRFEGNQLIKDYANYYR